MVTGAGIATVAVVRGRLVISAVISGKRGGG